MESLLTRKYFPVASLLILKSKYNTGSTEVIVMFHISDVVRTNY